MADVDLAIIGTGSGNTIATQEFDDWQIAIIEESTFGGTCSNVGCIPTKMFVYPADVARAVTDASRLALDVHLDGVRWADLRDRIHERTHSMSVSGREWRRTGRANTRLIEEHVEFEDAHTLRTASGDRLTADHIVIAAGSRAVIPALVTASGVPYHTSDTIMWIDELPRRLVILGGGYISAEFAHIFSSFGVQVTVVSRGPTLLRHADRELSDRFTTLVSDRWDVRLDAELVSVDRVDGGVRLGFGDGTKVDGDLLLVATGRVPNSDRLNLAAAGVTVHPDGRIAVDKHQRTSVENIWALGDVCSPDQLKHVANLEARVVAHNLLHPDALLEADHRYVPSAIFTNPQMAGVGMTEAEAVASGRPHVTAVREYSSVAYGWAMNEDIGFCKLIAEPETGELLGAHIMGEQAATLIQPLIQAMSFGLPAREMARGQYWIHPALPEVVENALLALDVPRLAW
ncbi:MAG TPA: mycothione reductase, partial [Jatrophihabitantaceae bacterium]|nr:mycothione reductase [Jatrophihabitantaceae bacterium]